MQHDYTMFGWKASHFAAKLRGYLNHKKISYREQPMNIVDMVFRIRPNLGNVGMPTLVSRAGEWMADTPVIMEALEKRHPERSIGIESPRQKIMAMLLENWIDDGWIAVSMQTRWSYPENWENLLRADTARSLLPGVPLFLSQRITDRFIKGYLDTGKYVVGVRTGGQDKLIERWALRILDALEIHFNEHAYLFGSRPTVADFALLGSIGGHLNRDPWPKREWIAPRPAVRRWEETLHAGAGEHGDLLPDDAIPATLIPVIQVMFEEFPTSLSSTVAAIESRVTNKALNPGDPLPRLEKEIVYRMNGEEFGRQPFVYTAWRAQRIQNTYNAMTLEDRGSVDALCTDLGCADLMTRNYGPKLERDGLGAKLAA